MTLSSPVWAKSTEGYFSTGVPAPFQRTVILIDYELLRLRGWDAVSRRLAPEAGRQKHVGAC